MALAPLKIEKGGHCNHKTETCEDGFKCIDEKCQQPPDQTNIASGGCPANLNLGNSLICSDC